MRIAIVALVFALGCGLRKGPEKPKEDKSAALQKELDDTKAELGKVKGENEDLKKTDAEKAAREKELQDKLAAAVGANGEVVTADGAVRLALVDQILFPTGKADLTPQGKEVLAKVGSALKEINDKQIWVQGHTDDQPIYVKKPAEAKPEPKKPEPKPAKGAPPAPKGGAKAPPPPKEVKAPPPPEKNDAVLVFVTNWELSAARALTVVHYLQDEAKIEPARLAAVAFSEYRPVSKNRAKNRRIEIVLYPRVVVAPK
jgi:chemotaxis protein MotB